MTYTTEQRRENGRKAMMARTPEERKEMSRRAMAYRRQSRPTHALPEKMRAGQIARYAVKAGHLKRSPCLLCGKRAQMYHHLGYAWEHWLDVVWLCPQHHGQVERGLLRAPRTPTPEALVAVILNPPG